MKSHLQLPQPQNTPGIVEFVTLTALLTSLVALSIDSVLPAMPMIAAELKLIDYRHTQWIIAAFVLGMSPGQLFFGVLADARGRRFSIFLGVGIFCGGALLSMWATSFTTLLLGRVLQGFGAAGPRIACMAMVRDQYQGNRMAQVKSFVQMVFVMVPMVAPMLGQWILLAADWRAIFSFSIVLALAASLWLLWRQPETLLTEYRRPFELPQTLATAKRILRNPWVVGFAIAIGLIFGGLLSYIASSQAIFQTLYGLGDKFPYVFAALTFAIGLASLVNGVLVMRYGAFVLVVGALTGLIVFASCLTLIAAYSAGVPPLVVFLGIGFALYFCIGILLGNLFALSMIPLGRMAGIGAAIVFSVSNLVAVVVSTLVGWFFTTSVTPIFGGIALCGVAGLMIVLAIRNESEAPIC